MTYSDQYLHYISKNKKIMKKVNNITQDLMRKGASNIKLDVFCDDIIIQCVAKDDLSDIIDNIYVVCFREDHQ